MLSIPEEIIIRNLQKTATEDEIRLLNEWLHSDKKHVELYSQMGEIWDSRNSPDKEFIRKGWNRLYKDINNKPQKRLLLSPHSKKSNTSLWIGYVAAVFAGALIASAVWFGLAREKSAKQEVLVQNVVYNHTGVQTLLLPDGSEVFINENSKLTFPEEFTGDKRMIQLEGSAFFDVHKNTGQPFIVRTGNIDVNVTGTEFFINSQSEKTTIISLISGSVDVNYTGENGKKTSVKLTQGEEAKVDILKGNIAVTTTDISYYIAWKDGTYRFTDVPLEKIAHMIAKRLDLDIQTAPALKTKRFTGRVTLDDNIQSILETISMSYPVRYQISGKTIKIFD